MDLLAGEAVATPAAMPLKLLEFWKEAEAEAEASETGVPLVAFPNRSVDPLVAAVFNCAAGVDVVPDAARRAGRCRGRACRRGRTQRVLCTR